VIFDEEKRFGLVVRLDKDYRQSIDDVKNLSVALPGGGQIPFEQIANVEIKSGPAQVSRENTKRRITIGFNVRNRDVQTVISEVTKEIDQQVKLPTGYYIAYGGQFQNLEAAKARLAIAVPVALLLIFVLLFFTFHSVKQTLLIYTAVPMSLIGGVLALWLRGMNFSISAGVGFIALFGIAVLNGIVLIAEFNRLEKEEGITDITERVLKGLHTRLRPVIMTAAVASLGFLPMALSTSAGAEVQKPLATVVIGGLITATLLTLIVLPIFYIFFSTNGFHKLSEGLKKLFKRKSGVTALVILLLISAVTVNAQQSPRINLKQAIQMALDSNLSVRSSAYSVDVQKALKGAAWDIPKTSIDGQFGQFNSYSKDNSFTVSQSFAFPTVYANQHKLANANVKSSEWELRSSRLEIATQVKQVYGQLAYLLSKQKLFLRQDSLYTGFQRAAELRMKTGETNQLEMITARSQAMEVRNQLQQVKADILIFNQKLQVLLNTNESVLPADTVLQRTDFLYNSNSVVSENPQMGFALQQIELSHIEAKLEKSKLLPDLNIGYFSQTIRGDQTVNGVPHSFGLGNRFTAIQAGITIPLWFGSHIAKIKASKLKEKVTQFNAESYSKSLSGNYNSLLGEYAKYNNSLNYYEKQAVPEANLIIDQTTKSYKVGAIDYLDYIQSLSRALSIKQSYLDALNNYNQTIISIEFITGKIF